MEAFAHAVLACLYPPEVLFEFLRELNLPHSAQREAGHPAPIARRLGTPHQSRHRRA
jgi:hypothetical protein